LKEDKSIQANVPSGGLNTDHDVWAVSPPYPNSDWLYSMNFRAGGADGAFNHSRINLPGNELVEGCLPEGENKCLGSIENESIPSVIFFNWNSERQDGIYQYFPNQPLGSTGTIIELWRGDLGFDKNWTLHSADVVEKRFLYWVLGAENSNGVAGNPPRVLDLVLANDYLKKREYRLILPAELGSNPDTSDVIRVSLYDQNGDLDESLEFACPRTTLEETYELLASTINTEFAPDVEVEFCECELILKIMRFGAYCSGGWTLELEYLEIEAGVIVKTYPALLIPKNFYFDDSASAVLNRSKAPPACPPLCVMGFELGRRNNLLARRWFQFAYRFRYHGGETSIIGSISSLLYNAGTCWSDGGSVNNVINIKFEDPRLSQPEWLTVLIGVDLVVRYGNERPWQLVKAYDLCDIDPETKTVKFYNDGNYQVLEAETNRLVNRVPRIALAQGFAAKRGYLGACLEGFDNLECVDARATLRYEDDGCEEVATGTVKVVVRITDYHRGARQVIQQDCTAFFCKPAYGGMGPSFVNAVGARYLQQMPMAGWPAYAHGTDVHGVTVQVEPPDSYGIIVNEDGSFDATTVGNRNNIDAYIAAYLSTDPRSEVDLVLPVGTHIIRLASHRCGLASDSTTLIIPDSVFDYGNDGWRRTSTCVYRAEKDGDPPGTGEFEVVVKVEEGVTTAVNFYVHDVSNATIGNTSKALCGYLFDSYDDSDPEDINAAPAMELQDFGPVRRTNGGDEGGYYSKTDFNGFFYWTEEFVGLTSSEDYFFSFRAVTDIFIHFIGDSFFPNINPGQILGATPGTSIALDNEMRECVVWNKNTTARDCFSTKVQGRVVNQDGAALSGIKVLYGNTNRIATTDENGEYSIRVYADYREAASTPLPGDRTDWIVFKLPSDCCATFLEANIIYIEGFGCALPYSDDVPKLVDELKITLTEGFVSKRWKRRNTIQLGLTYEDEHGNLFGAQPFPEKLYIPFWTEPGYLPGRPVVGWEISHAPPKEAVRFHLLRQLNAEYNRYIQFVINDVKYVRHRDATTGEISETTAEAGDATEIHLEMESFGFYLDENAGSTLSFVPAIGDRVTFLRDKDGELFEKFFDFRLEGETRDPESDLQRMVIKYQADLPELFPGTLIELYTPKLVVSQELYFEIAECHDIIDAGTDAARHSGTIDQVIGVLPATGDLVTGDTYYRPRKMPVREDIDGLKTYFERKVEDPRIYDNDPESEQACIGRPNVYDPESRETFHYGRIRASEAYQFNGDIRLNGYSSFGPFEKEDLDQDFGAVMRIVLVGEATNLIVVCKFQIQPIYTSASQVYDFQGEKTVGRSGNPINLGEPIKLQVGTQHPESVVATERFIYGYDMQRQIFWRYGQNGTDPISDLAFRKEAIAISRQLRPYANTKVFSGYNREQDEVYWTIASIQSTAQAPPDLPVPVPIEPDPPSPQKSVPIFIGRTIFWCEREGRRRWEGDASFVPEAYGVVSNDFITFRDGQLYLHGYGPRNTFYGTFTPSRIRVVASLGAGAIKIFSGCRVIATRKPSAPRVKIMETEMYPNGMRSRTSKNNVRGAEGDWWVPFFHDMTDPSFVSPQEALANGRELRGHVLILDLEIDSTEEAVFSLVDISSSPSRNTR